METGLEIFSTESVEQFARLFEEAFNRRDSVRMAGFYARDAWLIGENMAVIKGRDGVENFWRSASHNTAIKSRTLTVQKVEATSELGYALGTCILAIRSAPLRPKKRNITTTRFGKGRATADGELPWISRRRPTATGNEL